MTLRAANFFFICLLLLAIVFPAQADVGSDFLVDVWTSERGLPDNSVTAVAQTPDGYLWVGTYNGLARFDGVRFVTFDPANTPALSHARIRSLFVDARGTLWINAYDGSLTTYRDGKFTLERRNIRFSEGDLLMVSTTPDEIVFLAGRGEIFRKKLFAPPGEGWDEISPPGHGIGSVACANETGTIWYRDGDKKLWQLAGTKFMPVTKIPGQEVDYLAADARGKIWIATDRGICVWDGKKFTLAARTESPATFLSIDSSNRVWAIVGGSICAWADGHWLFAPDAAKSIFSGNPNRISALEDEHGGEWFYNYGRGLWHADAPGHISELTTADNFPGERIYCVTEDAEGNWWAGLDASGLVRVRDRQFRAATDEKNPARAAKSVCEDGGGSIWIGILSGGLERWRDGASTNLFVTDAGGGSVFCICPDDKGRLWLSAGDEDLFIRENGRTRQITPVIHGVKTIFSDHAGRIWIGTTSGLFVSSNASPDEITPVTQFGRHSVRALAEDRNGNLWAGSGGGELYKISGETISLFHTDTNEQYAIWSLLAESDGTLWIGTFRGGLWRLRDGKFTQFGKEDGLPDNIICQILDDGAGNLWIGSHQGIFRASKSALDNFARGKIKFIPCVNYARADGLPSIECSGGYEPAAWRDNAGRLWFTTSRGATWIEPDKTKINSTPPPVVIEEILVDGRAENVPGKLLKIPPGKHQIEFRYTGLSFSSPERVQFRYKLDGVDSDWVLAGTRRSVQYNLLSAGDYCFHVIACNSDGVWNDAGAELRMRILPHFYETWWFRTLVGILILGAVAGIVRHTATKRLHEKMEELQRKQMLERERARIAKDIHDDLGASLTLIAVLGDLAKKEKDASRIEKMSATAREAVSSLDEIVWAVNPRNDTLAHLIDYTGQFATDYLRDAGIRCLLDVPDQMPSREVQANVRHNLFLVVKEALQNIVKHAHATEVWLRVNAESGLRIEIEDNGCGFDPSQNSPVNGNEHPWADGLRNMRQRLSEIGGNCEIQSTPGKGTTISVKLFLSPG